MPKCFKRIEFDAFVFSTKRWTEELGAIGLLMKSGRYGGGIYAHMDIALEFVDNKNLCRSRGLNL